MPTFVQIKKAGLRVAVPLYEALVLPFIPNKQHRSPRRYARTRTCYKGTSEMMYTSREHQMPQCLGIKIEFTRFRKAKNKARGIPVKQVLSGPYFDAFFICLQTPPKDNADPRRGFTATKILHFFEIYKEF